MLVVAARTADVAFYNTSLHRTFLPSVLDFKTTPSRFNFGEVQEKGDHTLGNKLRERERVVLLWTSSCLPRG